MQSTHTMNPTQSNVDMSVTFAGMSLKNPINTASGTDGQGYQFEAFYPVSTL